MERLILSIFPTKPHPEFTTVHLLNPEEKVTVGLLRERLHNINLVGKLVLCLDSEISKLFKEDHSFNDHGIYYEVYFNSNFDLDTYKLEQKVKKLQTKLKKKYTEEVHSQLQLFESDLIAAQNRLAFVLVPLEHETKK